MSWLSTLVHNNSGLVNALPGGSVVNALFNPAKVPGVVPDATLAQRFQGGQGRPPITVDSQSRKIGIPLPGGGVIGGQETVVRRYGPQSPGTGVAVVPQGTQLVCQVQGYHLNKSKNRVTGQEAHSYCVRNRSMNFANGHAAMRAVRRIKGTLKLLHKIEKVLGHKRGRSSSFTRGRSCGCKR